MSATIRVVAPEVTGVLLADGWHQVDRGSFRLGPYALVSSASDWYDQFLDGLGESEQGFAFTDEQGRTFAGPIASILATRA
ncbi:hypothetical protein ACFYUY_01610 [Kitasatospora sp. NPDC004745]|uniref:hypothetical protein n=1 Tax=Kitasatospora sp. NPDC004745 TaxID=3364019 RepID=UPI0036A077B9